MSTAIAAVRVSSNNCIITLTKQTGGAPRDVTRWVPAQPCCPLLAPRSLPWDASAPAHPRPVSPHAHAQGDVIAWASSVCGPRTLQWAAGFFVCLVVSTAGSALSWCLPCPISLL